jgi:L-Ala-D/L-Glu epimerase
MPRIKRIEVWKANLGNTKPYTIAFKTVDEVNNAFVEITLDNGLTGIGSGNPSEYVVGESFAQCMAALESDLSFLGGRDIREIRQLNFEILKKFPRNPSARAALDIALHDVFTKYLDVPLVRFLGQKIRSLPTSNTIGIKNVEDTLREAEDYVARGFKILKVKLGKDPHEDIERIIKLRERFGESVVIRIDANQGYTKEQTIQFFERTRALNVELIEQPLPATSLNEMRGLPEEVREKIAADESLINPSDAFSLITPPIAARIFNIKLMKCGGITEALRIADVARLGGAQLFWGCNDESIVSITAALHAAFACEHTKYIDLDGSLDLAQDLVTGGFILEDGVMRCSDKPGLGVERIRS